MKYSKKLIAFNGEYGRKLKADGTPNGEITDKVNPVTDALTKDIGDASSAEEAFAKVEEYRKKYL